MNDLSELSPEHKELAESLIPFGYTAFKVIPNQGLCCLGKFNYTMGIMTGLNQENFYNGRYCYPDPIQAAIAFVKWDGTGDPSGDWVKYKGVGGERENPNRNE